MQDFVGHDQLNSIIFRWIENLACKIWRAHSFWSRQFVILIIAIAPLFLLSIDTPAGRSAPQLAWSLEYALLNYSQLTFSYIMWQRMKALAPVLDQMLSTVPSTLTDGLFIRIQSWLRIRIAIAFMVLFTIFGAAAVLIAFSASHIEKFTVYGSIIWASFIAGHSAFCVIFGYWFAYSILRLPNLNLTWPAPINTPALSELNRAASQTARLGLVLFLLVQMPLTASLVAHRNSESITVIYIVAFLLTAGLVTLMGLVGPMTLSRCVCKEKDRMLSQANAEVAKAYQAWQSSGREGCQEVTRLERLNLQTQLYMAIDSSRDSYLSPGTVTQYVASLAAVAVQFAIPIIFR